MKMLGLAIVLMALPWVGYARGWEHSNHNRHYHQKHDGLYFWQDIERDRYSQHIRIDKGIKNGQLTRREIRTLEREQKHVAKQIKHFKRHRHMSYANKKSIIRHMDHYSNKIAHLKHNDRYARKHRHNHRVDSHNNDYRDNRRLSWKSNNFASGFYFRF